MFNEPKPHPEGLQIDPYLIIYRDSIKGSLSARWIMQRLDRRDSKNLLNDDFRGLCSFCTSLSPFTKEPLELIGTQQWEKLNTHIDQVQRIKNPRTSKDYKNRISNVEKILNVIIEETERRLILSLSRQGKGE